MYISITKQHLDKTFSRSASDFVDYLQKENQGKEPEVQEHFFDQENDRIPPEQVTKEIDGNTAKLKKTEPKFYSLTINPSQRELKAINNDPELLRRYVREAMRDYAASFHRDRPVTVDDIKYFAKIEHGRTFKGFDREVKENRPYRAQIVKLENDIRKIERGELQGDIRRTEKRIAELYAQIPHKIHGEAIVQGMKKPGFQTHVHIIVSRKDVTNRYSLSPGSKYMESESKLNGRLVKRGFNRNLFYERAEKTFDTMFDHKRNFVETYGARKTYLKNPHKYFARLLDLPTSERSAAFKILGKAGVKMPIVSIPTSKVQVALKTIKKFKRAMDVARSSGSIGI
ncbi:MobB family relaxase [Pricia sp. S334]|uniref:MobB family relaxase n=1 Tax=Pricia mediterranea TaxID=3076079 RepID=A0ABU3L3R5_9FLAO|nr:MobB family relaxase [Pricia sp. S334]MDT7828385.1 MobB family relaxase [Pricia sp. S334]